MPLQLGFNDGQLNAVVNTRHLRLRTGYKPHTKSRPRNQLNQIGKVIFLLGVIILDLWKHLPEKLRIYSKNTGITEAYLLFLR